MMCDNKWQQFCCLGMHVKMWNDTRAKRRAIFIEVDEKIRLIETFCIWGILIRNGSLNARFISAVDGILLFILYRLCGSRRCLHPGWGHVVLDAFWYAFVPQIWQVYQLWCGKICMDQCQGHSWASWDHPVDYFQIIHVIYKFSERKIPNANVKILMGKWFINDLKIELNHFWS